MQPISGDTWAVWIADDGLDRSHGDELLLYTPPDPVAGDVSGVWVAEGGYQWSYDDRLEELSFVTLVEVPSAAAILRPPAPNLSAGAQIAIPAAAGVLNLPAPAFSNALLIAAPATVLVPALFSPQPVAGFFRTVPASALVLSVRPPLFLNGVAVAVPSMATITAVPAASFASAFTLQVPGLSLVGSTTRPHLLIVPSPEIPGQTVYDLTLTGAADGQPDVVLPMSTCQGRLRDGTPSFLQVTVPNAAAWAEAVTLRPNGQLVVRKGKRFADGSRQMEEIARVNLETIADDRGGRSQTLTLSGHLTTAASDPKPVVLAGLTYRHAGTGQRRYRGRLDPWLRPGDTAVIAEYGEQVVVGLITYVVQARPASETMEITEA